MHKISKTGPEYADHRLNQEGAGFFLPHERPLLAVSGRSKSRDPNILNGRFRPGAVIRVQRETPPKQGPQYILMTNFQSESLSESLSLSLSESESESSSSRRAFSIMFWIFVIMNRTLYARISMLPE